MTQQEIDLPKGWITVLLPDVVKNEKFAIKRGPFGSHLKKEFFVKSGYKVYEQQHAINNDFTLGKYYVNEEKFQELKSFEVKSDDIIISCSGTIGKIAVIPENIKKGITKIRSIARLQEIKTGKLKNLVKNNKLFVDGSHNPLGAKVLTEYLNKLECKKHIILGMMENKDHLGYTKFFKNNISSITTIDIPNQINSINGNELMKKLEGFKKISYKKSLQEAITSIELEDNDIVLITGSLYLAGEALNLN